MFEKKDYINVGASELKVTPITLGTMTFGDQNNQEEAFEQLDYAISIGINSIDCAELYPVPPKAETYTRTETILGNWLKKINRESIILSTKIAGPRRSLKWIRGGPSSLDEKNMTDALNESLKRLQTEYVDILYLHWPERNVPMFGQYKFEPKDDFIKNEQIHWVSIEDQLKTLQKFIRDGKVRYIALSNEWPWGVMEFLRVAKSENLPLINAVQNSYSLINRAAELGMTEILFREKIGFFAYSPLAFGHLTGKYILNPREKGRVTLFEGYAKRFDKPGVPLAVEKYFKLSQQYEMSLTQMALSFVMSQWFVTSTIVGATKLSQLKENVEAYSTQLSDEILKDIENIHLQCMNPAP
jgi:aryl-alcohol dehydrogenase-like predicted oxidoreductase